MMCSSMGQGICFIKDITSGVRSRDLYRENEISRPWDGGKSMQSREM